MSRITSRRRGVVVCLQRNLGPGVLLAVLAAADPVLADEVAEAIGRRLERAAAEGDEEAFSKVIAYEAIADRAVRLLKNDEIREGVRGGLLSSISQLGRSIITSVSSGGHYDFLRVRERKGHTFLLFRLIGPNSSLDYHEYLLTDGEQGQRRIEDLYQYSIGAFISESTSRAFRLFEKRVLDPKEQREAALIARFAQAADAGKPEDVVRAYKALPERLRREKSFAAAYVKAASQLGEVAYRSALKLFLDYFPDEIAGDLLGIDFFFAQELYGDAQRCVDRIGRTLGGDPYLDVIRASLYLHAGDSERAVERAKAAILAEKDLLPGYYVLLDIALATENHSGTVKGLDAIERRFQLVF